MADSPHDLKSLAAAVGSLLLGALGAREFVRARVGRSKVLSGLAVMSGEDFARSDQLRKQLAEELERVNESLREARKEADRERVRRQEAEDLLGHFFQETRSCAIAPEDCPARRIHDERRLTNSGRFPPLPKKEDDPDGDP